MDGGSTDCTLTTVQKNSARVARLISEPDSEVYDAFNKGLRAATGDVIAFLNCGDDYTSTGVVSRMAQLLSAGDIQAAFADVLIVDARDSNHVIRRYSSKKFSPSRMAYGLMPAHPSLFMRRNVYERIGEYDSSFRIAGDFELCLRAFLRASAKYRYLDEATVRMPIGGPKRGWRSKWTITREMQRACAINQVNTNLAKLCLRFPLKLLEMA